MTEIAVRPLDNVSFDAERSWLRRYGFIVAAYIVTTLATGPYWMGDTVDYVESIVQFSRGVDHWMWDFAHLLWRPLGWVLSTAFAPVTSAVVGKDEHLNVIATLNTVSWIAGLVCVICIYSLARRFSGSAWIANVVSLAFVFTQVFLNWTQAGSAYVPGLALVLVGFVISIKREGHPLASVLAGAALAGAVCVWVPYLLAVPAAVVAPLVLFGFTRQRIRFAFQIAIVSALLTASVYLAVIAGLRLHSLYEIQTWIAMSGHGADYHGARRMVFGFARSFINMGNDGLLFKRYLLKDPFNPVSLRDLLGTTVLKLGLFYLFVAGVIASVVRAPNGKRILALCIVNAIPVMVLAFFFASSEPERYLPLFPTLFVAIAASLAAPSRVFKAVALVFLPVMVITNLAVVSKPVRDRQQKAAVSRIRDLLPRLDDRSVVFAATYQDDLMTFSRTFPFHPVNRNGRLHLSTLVSPGTSWNTHWREDFAYRVLATWRNGGATWISKRAFADRPLADWNWAEGDDRRVSWKDFPLLCNQFELGEDVGGPDGFVHLLASPHNQQVLAPLAAKSQS